MERCSAVREALVRSGVVGIVRCRAQHDLVRVVEALSAGGLRCVEITMNTPGALEALRSVAAKLPDVVLGAGTVLDRASASLAVLAGAQFLITPTVERDVIEFGRSHGCVVICGAMTPSEIHVAWKSGADFVKVFPADVLGPQFFRAMQGPFPQIPLAPTGGISAGTASEYVKAGAAFVCAGGWLVDETAIMRGAYELLSDRARELRTAVEESRA